MTKIHDNIWYKLCALLLFKSGTREICITTDDVKAFGTSGYANIILRTQGDIITLSLVSDSEAEQSIRTAGGLPMM